MIDAVAIAVRHGLEVTVIGRGSNVLIDDAGIPGLVILLARTLDSIVADPETGRVSAGAGAPLPKVALRAARAGIADLSFLSGIPGTIGGAVAMNAGLGGRGGTDVKHILDSVRVLDPAEGSVRDLDAAGAGLRYRGSRLGDRGLVILGASLQGRPGADPAALAKEGRALRARRAERQPLQRRTSGSVFTQPEGQPPAGLLIDRAGLKGYRRGDAVVSTTHANWIENLGNATAEDVRQLMTHVERVILERDGVRLEREVRELPRPRAG
jgi:UDP-N-acetylmuramate dehydrogenase